MKGSDKAG